MERGAQLERETIGKGRDWKGGGAIGKRDNWKGGNLKGR